jgi:hypothetical protein
MRRSSAYARNPDLRLRRTGAVEFDPDAPQEAPVTARKPPNTAGGVLLTAAYAALAVGVPYVGYKALGMTGLVVGGAIGVPLAAIALYKGSSVWCEARGGHHGLSTGCTGAQT